MSPDPLTDSASKNNQFMTTDDAIHRNIAEHIQTIELVRGSLIGATQRIGHLVSQSLSSGGTLFWCGNGGSAADSQHLAAELVGRFKKNRRPLRSVALTTDTSVLTCVANDYSYEDIFARQLEALGRSGDVLLAISTSGNSENVIRAIKTAKSMGITTIAWLGKDGGSCKDLADHALVIPSDSTARIQEAHILIGHILCELVEQELGLA
ncbi:MAG: D-sedoheptulose 7-phosphate isomerase [Sulfuricella sp.]|nr:D-sedoheptulose 7-phosphate isomerase [Sulfuricella sp.]